MHDTRDAVAELQRQGIEVKVSIDKDGNRYHVGGVNGVGGYLLRSQHLLFLQGAGKLSLSGVEELDRQIREKNDAALKGKMEFDRWGVECLDEDGEEKFVLVLQNTNAQQGQPVMHTSEPMSEKEMRAELAEVGASTADAIGAIAKARANKS